MSGKVTIPRECPATHVTNIWPTAIVVVLLGQLLHLVYITIRYGVDLTVVTASKLVAMLPHVFGEVTVCSKNCTTQVALEWVFMLEGSWRLREGCCCLCQLQLLLLGLRCLLRGHHNCYWNLGHQNVLTSSISVAFHMPQEV